MEEQRVTDAEGYSGWDFTCDLEVDYGSELHASIVYAALAVDKELQPDKVKRQMFISDGKLLARFEAVEARLLRASFSSFVDLVTLATKTIEEFETGSQMTSGRCKDFADGSESWVDYESLRRYESMMQLMTHSSETDVESPNPLAVDDVFISVMEKDRVGRVRCTGSAETLNTLYEIGGSSSSTKQKLMEDRLKIQDRLKAQEEQIRARDEQIKQMRTQLSELDQMRTQLSELDQMRTQMHHMNTLLIQLHASQTHRGASPAQTDDEIGDETDDYSDG